MPEPSSPFVGPGVPVSVGSPNVPNPVRRRHWLIREGGGFLLFAVVGGTGVGVNLAVYLTVLRSWPEPLGAATLSFAAATAWNFSWNWNLAFRRHHSRPWPEHLLGYVLIALVALGLNLLGLSLLLSRLGSLLSQLGGIAAGSLWGYGANRTLNFRAVEPTGERSG
jgi:putative flippase GtrA